MTRHTPLSPGKPMRRTALRRQSAKHRKGQAEWARITRQVMGLHVGVCCVHGFDCTWFAEHGHHILPRSQGGKNVAENCLPCCRACHSEIHSRPEWAIARGFMRTRKVGA